MSISVGVVVPTFNGGRFLEGCLQSLLQQHYPGLKIVVMDGGSTDDSVEILKRYGDQIEWVSEPDNGQSDAINKGFRRLDVDLVGWLNSDDELVPGAIERVVAAYASDRLPVLIHGDVDVINEVGQVLYQSQGIDLDWDRVRASRGKTIQPGSFYRKDVVDRLGGVDEELHLLMDVDLWTRLLKEGCSRRVKGPLARFRVHSSAKSSRPPYVFYGESLRLAWRHEKDRLATSVARRVLRISALQARHSLGLHAPQLRYPLARLRRALRFGRA